MSDQFDEDGNNVTASFLLNDHHPVVGTRDKEGYIDNCERCGFAVGWVQPTTTNSDEWGHATLASSRTVRTWIKKEKA